MQRELLSVREVGDLMGLSPQSVRRLSEAGQLPRPIKLRNSVRWVRGDLMAWIESRRQFADVESGPSRSHRVHEVPQIGRP